MATSPLLVEVFVEVVNGPASSDVVFSIGTLSDSAPLCCPLSGVGLTEAIVCALTDVDTNVVAGDEAEVAGTPSLLEKKERSPEGFFT